MKLLNKATLYYLLVSLLIFAAGGIVIYYAIQAIVKEEVDEQLYFEKEKVLGRLNDSVSAPPFPLNEYTDVKRSSSSHKDLLRDTTLFNPADGELLPFRQLVFSHAANGKIYEVTISKSLLESDDLVEAIAKAFLITALILLISIVLLNRFISRSLWRSFEMLLADLKHFRVQDKKAVVPKATRIREFDELGAAIGQMTTRMVNDYTNLRQFTENASHEMQTPLAVIRTKAELLIQSPGMKEAEMQKLLDIQEAVRKLSQMNRSLLLLARIENDQFAQTTPVAMQPLIQKLLANYEDLVAEKKIVLEASLSDVIINMHATLAEMLLNNLIHNAIRHNLPGGKIRITLDEKAFVIANSGVPLRVDAHTLFERFGKNDASADSIGLGLAIVREICEKSGFTVEHQFNEGEHIFSIKF
ncbi:MAG: HAMP domain-containing histidine kinase [Bacteroidota bacterium]|nr:HAMP domain-containing histidine kinase [Bacteroidota bacterium]